MEANERHDGGSAATVATSSTLRFILLLVVAIYRLDKISNLCYNKAVIRITRHKLVTGGM